MSPSTPPSADIVSIPRLAHGFVYFLASFAATGTQSVVPQMFFSTHYPSRKLLLVPLCLVSAGAASLGGVTLSARFHQRLRSTPGADQSALRVMGGAVALSSAGLFVFEAVLPYMLCCSTLAFSSQFLLDGVDRRLVRATQGSALGEHAQIATAAQLIGIVTAPLWFGLVGARAAFQLAAAAALGVGALYTLSRTARLTLPSAAAVDLGAVAAPSAITPQDRRFLAYVMAMFAAMFVFVANFFFVVEDYYGLPHPARTAGALLAGGNLVSIVAIWKMRRKRLGPRAAGDLRVVATMLAALLLLVAKIQASVPYLALLASLTGAAYGVFLLDARRYASERAHQAAHSGLLSAFNAVSSGAALVGFLLSLLVSLAGRKFGWPHVPLAAGTAGTALLLAGALLLATARKTDVLRPYSRRD